MRTTNHQLLPTVLSNLKLLGENIRLARLRRNLPMDLICERANVSKPTLIAIEKGSPTVSIGAYASVLHALQGNSGEFAKVMREDEVGRTILDLNLKTPRRAQK